MHGCRFVKDLAYREKIIGDLPQDPYIGEFVANQLVYYPTVTREPFENQGRISTLIASGKLSADIGLPPLSPERDRVMLCGSTAMLADIRANLEGAGLSEGSSSRQGHFVVEKAFVE